MSAPRFTRPHRDIGFWLVQGPGWVMLAYLIYAQGIPAFDYQLGVQMGTQESAQEITQVGVAFFYGFAFGDVVVYIPMLAIGLYCHWRRGREMPGWSRGLLLAALGITVYWPVVSLATVSAARGAPGWQLSNETAYWIVLPVIALWGVIALWRVADTRHGDADVSLK